MEKKLTTKKEAFCQAFVKLGDKSEALRASYNTTRMKPETIHAMASRLSSEYMVATRIKELQAQIKEDNKATLEEVIEVLANMLRFDVGEMYDEHGNLLNIKKMPKAARLMISQIESDEISFKDERIVQTKKVKVFDKMQAVEKFMKHFGGYEKDNFQKKVEVTQTIIKWGDKEINV